MKLIYKYAASLLTIFGVFSLSCGEDDTVQKEIIRPVRYQQVVHSGNIQTRTFAGVSKAGTETSLSFRVGGIIVKIYVSIGQKITKGTLVAEIDDSDAQLNLEKILSEERNALIQLESAESNLQRVKSLFEDNNISLSEYEDARNQFASVKTNYENSVNNTSLKQREIGYYNLYSPVSGIVTAKPVAENENIKAGQVIAELSSEGDMKVVVGIPEIIISRVNENMNVIVKFSSLPNKFFDGNVTEVSYSISESSTYPVTVTLKSFNQSLRPGMPADVIFKFQTNDNNQKMIVPSSAVGKDLKGNFVFILEEKGAGLAMASRRLVTVGEITSEGFEVLNGLQDGELVVTAGVESITDGVTVKLLK